MAIPKLGLSRRPSGPFLSEYPHLQLLRHDGSLVSAAEAFKGKKYILIFFSAHWCPPCQRFTPLLADFYNKNREACNFEVLFVSSDRDERHMLDYFQNRLSNYVIRQPPNETSSAPPTVAPPQAPIASGHASWLALPFSERSIARRLARMFSVASIPKVIVVANENACAVTREGKLMVMRDPEATGFPWRSVEVDMKGQFYWRHVLLLLFTLFSIVYYFYVY